MKTKRIAVDLPVRKHEKFTKMCDRLGLKKKKALENMIESWTLNAEANPQYFSLLKRQEKTGA